MKSIEDNAISVELMAALQDAADQAANDIRDPVVMAQACADMDSAREETRREIGELNVAVDLVRAVRDDP